MKYPFAVKIDGVYYPANTETPKAEEAASSRDVEDNPAPAPDKTKKGKQTG